VDFATLLPVLLIIAAAIGANVYRKRQMGDRRATVTAIASKGGWRYFEDEPGLAGRWPGDPFGRGDHPDVTNVIRGSWGARKFIAFDYSYQLRHGLLADRRGGGITIRHGVVVMKLPAGLPYLQVQHENLLGEKVADLLTGEQDIQFESDEFNRLFRITADDTWYARAVIHPRMMNLLMERGEVGWRVSGGDLVGWHRGHHTEEELRRRLDFLATLIEEIPTQVWIDHDPQLGN
jgi:hypothetical protein